MDKLKILLFAALLAATSSASAKTVEMDVNGLVCAFCAQGIEKTLRGHPETADVFVSLEHRIVALEFVDGADLDDDTLRRALTDAGYAVTAIRRGDGSLQAVRERVAAEAGGD